MERITLILSNNFHPPSFNWCLSISQILNHRGNGSFITIRFTREPFIAIILKKLIYYPIYPIWLKKPEQDHVSDISAC